MFGLESSQWLLLAVGLLGVVNHLLLRTAGRDSRRLQAILEDLEGATAPTLARTLTTETARDGAVLARLMNCGLVREGMPGHFYMVESEWQGNSVTVHEFGAIGDGRRACLAAGCGSRRASLRPRSHRATRADSDDSCASPALHPSRYTFTRQTSSVSASRLPVGIIGNSAPARHSRARSGSASAGTSGTSSGTVKSLMPATP